MCVCVCSWEGEVELFKAVDPEASKWNVQPRSIAIKLVKAVEEDEFWIRLLKDKPTDKAQVKIDWDRYQDEVRSKRRGETAL